MGYTLSNTLLWPDKSLAGRRASAKGLTVLRFRYFTSGQPVGLELEAICGP